MTRQRIHHIWPKDVQEWTLRESDQHGARVIASGSHDVRLMALLTITRRPSPPLPPAVASIIGSLALPADGSQLRLLWHKQDRVDLPHCVGRAHFSSYLPFVHREAECRESVQHFETQFNTLTRSVRTSMTSNC